MSTNQTSTQSLQEKKLRAKIAELKGKKHLPEQMVDLVATVATLQNSYLPTVAFAKGRESLSADTIQKISPPEQRYTGLSILPGKDFPIDMPLTEDLAAALLKSIPTAAPMLKNYAEELATVLTGNPSILEAACNEIRDTSRLDKDMPLLEAWGREHPDAPHFFRFVLTSAAMPSRVTLGRILGQEHDNEKAWPHGHCPVCGNQPLMGRLEGKEGRRMHTCSFCAFEYRAARMGCPFCLAPETEGSEYHVSDDEPGYLLSVCNACKNYFKIADFREFDRPWFPLLDDLSSLTLDLYAMQMGYKRPTLSGWGF